MNLETENHQAEAIAKDDNFVRGNETISRIVSAGDEGLEQFVAGMPEDRLDALFGATKEDSRALVACVDEGIAFGSDQRGALRIAGSGILLDKDRAIERWKAAGVTVVTAHEGCGAAKLYCDEHGIDTENPSRYVAALLEQWAAEAELEFAYLDTLQRPDYHDARAVSIIATDDFEPNNVPDYPKSFVVSADGSVDEIVSDAILSAKIALGDHGFGSRFSSDNPLLIGLIAVGLDQEKRDAITAALRQNDWFAEHADRIKYQIARMEDENATQRLAA
jgi:hypothetical protein